MTGTISPRILFTSLSAKSALYEEVLGNARSYAPNAFVIGCDCDPYCLASNKVEKFIEVPRLGLLSDTELLDICQRNHITHILPSSDLELPFWSEKKKLLEEYFITTWVSDFTFVKFCEDKLVFAKKWANASIPSVPTYQQPELSNIERWVVKERYGSGSRNIALDLGVKEAEKVASESQNEVVFQPFIKGKEFTAEIWVSRSNQCYGPLLRWRNKVIMGEAHQTTTFRNLKWESLLRSVFLHHPGAYGHCIAQVMVDISGNLNLIEINPRMGGASSLALRGGLYSIAWHLMEDSGCLHNVPYSPVFQNGISLTKNNGVVSYQFDLS